MDIWVVSTFLAIRSDAAMNIQEQVFSEHMFQFSCMFSSKIH